MAIEALPNDAYGNQVSPEKIDSRYFVAEDEEDDKHLFVIAETKAGVPDVASRDRVRLFAHVGDINTVEDDKDKGKTLYEVTLRIGEDELKERLAGKTECMLFAIDMLTALYGAATNWLVDMQHNPRPKDKDLQPVYARYDVIGKERPQIDMPATVKRRGVKTIVGR